MHIFYSYKQPEYCNVRIDSSTDRERKSIDRYMILIYCLKLIFRSKHDYNDEQVIENYLDNKQDKSKNS